MGTRIMLRITFSIGWKLIPFLPDKHVIASLNTTFALLFAAFRKLQNKDNNNKQEPLREVDTTEGFVGLGSTLSLGR